MTTETTKHAQVYTLAEIRNGTGWQRGIRFVEYTPLIAAAPEMAGWLSTLADALHANAQDDDAIQLAKRARDLLRRIEGE